MFDKYKIYFILKIYFRKVVTPCLIRLLYSFYMQVLPCCNSIIPLLIAKRQIIGVVDVIQMFIVNKLLNS